MPDDIDPSIRGNRECAEPVPLVRVDGIVVDPLRRAKAESAIGAAREHHVGPVAAEGSHAGHHVNIVVSRAAGAVNYQEGLPTKSAWIDRAAVNDATAEVDCRNLVKSRRDTRVLGVSRENTPK